MTTIQPNIDAYIKIKKRISDQLVLLKEMKKEENLIMKELKNYLNQIGEEGIRIDTETVISVTNHEKKIIWSKKEYENRVKQLLQDRGIFDDDFVGQLLNKTHDIVQQQRLKIIKK